MHLETPGGGVDQESRAYDIGVTVGSLMHGFTHPFSGVDQAMAAAASRGYNNIPIGEGSVKIGKNFYQVHAEVGGSGRGQVHVQVVRGPDKGTKFTDLGNLPRSVSKNEEIQSRLEKAREMVKKLTESQQ